MELEGIPAWDVLFAIKPHISSGVRLRRVVYVNHLEPKRHGSYSALYTMDVVIIAVLAWLE